MTKLFKEAIQDQDITELKMLIKRYERDINAHLIDELNYDFTEIKKLNQDAAQLLANLSKPTPPPLQPLDPHPHQTLQGVHQGTKYRPIGMLHGHVLKIQDKTPDRLPGIQPHRIRANIPQCREDPQRPQPLPNPPHAGNHPGNQH